MATYYNVIEAGLRVDGDAPRRGRLPVRPGAAAREAAPRRGKASVNSTVWANPGRRGAARARRGQEGAVRPAARRGRRDRRTLPRRDTSARRRTPLRSPATETAGAGGPARRRVPPRTAG